VGVGADRVSSLVATLLATGIAIGWAAATPFAVFGPEPVAGTDPTHVPISAVLAAIATILLTTK
jgi:hypothetical protein